MISSTLVYFPHQINTWSLHWEENRQLVFEIKLILPFMIVFPFDVTCRVQSAVSAVGSL